MALKTLSRAFMLLFLAAVPAAAWNLVECPPEVVGTWSQPDQALRAAKPGSPLYLPAPFPKSKDEVLADYVYEFQRLLKDTPAESLPKGAAEVLEGLRKKTLRYDVLRIVNWSPTRCGKERRLDAYHLVRVLDGRSGLEITRSVLEENGRLGVISSTVDNERGEARRLRPPDEEMRTVASRFKLRGEAPQYVTTFGTLRCPNVTPCLAFRAAGHVYLASYGGELFEIDPQGRRFEMGKDVGTPEKNEPILKSIGPEGRLVSLGGKVFTTARKRLPTAPAGKSLAAR
ncbi:MAG: hypothetical protein WAM82_05665 [Thermoanaerobaculia bacterium]